MRHRLIHYLDALFIGMILGLLFVTLVHASPAPQTKLVHLSDAMCTDHYPGQSGRRQGRPCRPPTPPDGPFGIRRFMKQNLRLCRVSSASPPVSVLQQPPRKTRHQSGPRQVPPASLRSGHTCVCFCVFVLHRGLFSYFRVSCSVLHRSGFSGYYDLCCHLSAHPSTLRCQ